MLKMTDDLALGLLEQPRAVGVAERNSVGDVLRLWSSVTLQWVAIGSSCTAEALGCWKSVYPFVAAKCL
jgi:hypothetical protein